MWNTKELSDEKELMAKKYQKSLKILDLAKVIDNAITRMGDLFKESKLIDDPKNVEKFLNAYKDDSDVLLDQTAKLYADTFTIEELDHLIVINSMELSSITTLKMISIEPTLTEIGHKFANNIIMKINGMS